MKSSGISSATPSSQPPGGQPRRSFALTGPSATLDPRTNAVRRDIADIRLAEQVFAPHYAAPLTMNLAVNAELRAATDPASDIVASLSAGDAFEVFEFAGGNAWGIAPALKLVGYLDASLLVKP